MSKIRYLTKAIEELSFSDHKMAFLAGPRQCGKTTLSKMMLSDRGYGNYNNWDDTNFRRAWTKNPNSVIPETNNKIPLIILDEIHKAKMWKRNLKGIFDTLTSPADILVTGSARLNIYKKGSDSLQGRYFSYRLHPFTLREMETPKNISSDELIDNIFSDSITYTAAQRQNYETIFRFGGFPEPLFAQNTAKARLWRRGRIEKVVHEDIRDLSNIPELSRIDMMVSLMPERIGSLFSLNSLREDLEVSYDTVKRWYNLLCELYYSFTIRPYTKKIVRALKKEGKSYLWDFAEITNEASRFENLVACHLLKSCNYWTDIGEGTFELYYLRNKEKEEIDFLITKDGVPWLPIEAKLNDKEPTSSWKKFLSYIPCKRGIQIIHDSNYRKVHKIGNAEILIISADRLLQYFI
ncbi:MAG: ATP-binding protein [Fibrobacteres bacterium]|nr:ATP-binding protein [Fibrobacterota bacterium]